jgi:hypothetical protein
VSLKKNKIGKEGVEELLSACIFNHKLVQMDLS